MTDYLDEIQARADAATDGPWHRELWYVFAGDREVAPVVEGVHDAEFIAHARTDVPRLVAALRAVEALHQPLGSIENPDDGSWCSACSEDVCVGNYPCPTITAIREALEAR